MPFEVEVSPDNIFAIVCTDFHVAYGPFVGAKAAFDAAELLTHKEGGTCKFVPMPFVFQGRLVGLDVGEQGGEEKWSELHPPGQYL